MDEMLAQFLVESRELVDQAADNLSALEKHPADAQRFDDAFRAFHTLKGGAGIVEFGAMQKALHSAEDALARARDAARPVSAGELESCLRCLDQVAEWLDDLEANGAIPDDADASEILALFSRATDSRPAPEAAARGDWVDALLRAHVAEAAAARTAVRYTPAEDSFFRQTDPLAVVAALPGLLALEMRPRAPWPSLDELDPFACNVVLTALLGASQAEVAAALGAELAHCSVESLAGRPRDAERRTRDERAQQLLGAQLQLLESADAAHEHGRVASAGRVAANVLRHLGKTSDAEAVETAAAVAIAESRAQPLLEAIAASLRRTPSPDVPQPAADAPRTPSPTVRVNAERIDAVVRLTGELIVAKNSLAHAVKLAEQQGSTLAAALKNQHAKFDRLVMDMQRAVVGMRVLPLRVAFQRFARLVRELSAELEKPAALVVEGEDTEADKAIVEALVEPLVHLVRNALDHGVEDARTRAAAGKPAVATIGLRASRAGEHVVVEVTDDGAGIDAANVKRIALERNLATAATIDAMSDDDALQLVFLPGFSTAKAVTELSGRGVGMDAVRTAVGRLGGQVEVRSAVGRGTTVRVTLPFSVLVTQVMTIEAGGQLFGIPLDAVVETIRVDATAIFPMGAAHAIVFRERTIPLVRLADILARGGRGVKEGPIVVAQLGGELGAVQVDRIGERMDIMLEPLDGLLADLPGLAGSTLLGDGSVLLVLDLNELIQ